MRGKGAKEGYEPQSTGENAPERPERHRLAVYGGHGRNEIERERDTWWAVSELAKGKTYREIAEALTEKTGKHLSHVQVWHDIEEVLVEWKRQNIENIDAYIAKDLARLEAIEARVLADYEKSKLPRPNEYASLMKRGYTAEEIDQLYEERGGMAGDPRYLDTLLRLQKQRMDLLGLSHGNDVAQQTVVNYNFADIDINDLSAIADKLQDNKKNEIDEQ